MHDTFRSPPLGAFKKCSNFRPEVVWITFGPRVPNANSLPQMECLTSVIRGDCVASPASICGKPTSDERRSKFRKFSVTRVVNLPFDDVVVVCVSSIRSSSGVSMPAPVMMLSRKNVRLIIVLLAAELKKNMSD